jgi:hypothetical protein
VSWKILATGPLLLASWVGAQPEEASVKTPPAALQLFQNDWVLMNWALKNHDSNHDILIDTDEARNAADNFRALADTDHDGRVTQAEYRAARKFILARE